jgi:hypothetical protein
LRKILFYHNSAAKFYFPIVPQQKIYFTTIPQQKIYFPTIPQQKIYFPTIPQQKFYFPTIPQQKSWLSTYKSEDANYAKIHSVQWYNKYNRFIGININISFSTFFKDKNLLVFSWGQKVLIFKFSALFCQLYSQNWSGRDLRSLKDVFTVLLAILTFAAELWENKNFAAELWGNKIFAAE